MIDSGIVIVVIVAAVWLFVKAVNFGKDAMAAFNIVMDMNPIGLVVIAIVALVAGLVIMYMKFKIVREIVQDVWGWIKTHWPLLLAILLGPVGIAIGFIIRHFSTVKKVVGDVFKWISGTWSKIYDVISGPFTKAFDFVKKAFQTFYNDVIKPVISTIGTVLGWLGLGSTAGIKAPGGGSGGPSANRSNAPGGPPVLIRNQT